MRKLLCGLLLAGFALPAAAQSGTGGTLSLDEAIALAKQNNPAYQQFINSRRRAEASLRSAYGTLLPTASANLGAGFRQGKPQIFQGVAFGSTSDILSSNWGLNFNYQLSAGALAALRATKSQLDAAEATISSQDQLLRAAVVQQYLLVLQKQAQSVLQDSLTTSAQLQLDLAKAKAGVGSATSLDVKRAEVAVGTQKVNVLRAHNDEVVERIRLFQQLGVPARENVTLVSTLVVAEPMFNVPQLIEVADKQNPTIVSLRAREEAAQQTYRATQSQYLPTLSASASFGGTAQQYKDENFLVSQARASALSQRASCLTTDSLRRGAGLGSIATQCNQILFTDAQSQSIRTGNKNFPFGFMSNPYTLSLGLSLPLFDGFSREGRIQNAAADRSDARYNTRAQELKLGADVAAANATLVADYQTVKLQEQNSQAAREALQLAQERYRVGLNSLVDLQQARSDFETAEAGRINAIFEYHRAFSVLESAVGRPLR
jgi:outer membrane protein